MYGCAAHHSIGRPALEEKGLQLHAQPRVNCCMQIHHALHKQAVHTQHAILSPCAAQVIMSRGNAWLVRLGPQQEGMLACLHMQLHRLQSFGLKSRGISESGAKIVCATSDVPPVLSWLLQL